MSLPAPTTTLKGGLAGLSDGWKAALGFSVLVVAVILLLSLLLLHPINSHGDLRSLFWLGSGWGSGLSKVFRVTVGKVICISCCL